MACGRPRGTTLTLTLTLTLTQVVSKDGVRAPAWYTRQKRLSERKQEEERRLWDGTAPSATPGPLPLGPAGARLKPAEGMARQALREANVRQRRLLTAFFEQYGDGDVPRFLGTGAAAAGAEAGGAEVNSVEVGGGSRDDRSASTQSAVIRAEMLALGLSRSATSSQSTRRLRLLRELEASVRELEGDGFREAAVLSKLKAQIKESYASAPPEFVEEARRADPFNDALPRLSLAEIAAELATLAGSGLGSVKAGLGKAVLDGPDYDSLNPRRKRGPRPQGNKIELASPEPRDGQGEGGKA